MKKLNERSQENKCYRRLKNLQHVQASGLCGAQCFSCLPKRFTQVYWWFSLSRHQNLKWKPFNTESLEFGK